MNLGDQLLQNLTDWRPKGEGRHSFSIEHEESGWLVHLVVEKQEAIGCSLSELSFTRTDKAKPWAISSTRAWAELASTKVQGLLERLCLVELDEPQNIALLRSESPRQRGEGLHYYELRLYGTTKAELKRYSAGQTTGAREQIPFILTHEAIAKLATDLCG